MLVNVARCHDDARLEAADTLAKLARDPVEVTLGKGVELLD